MTKEQVALLANALDGKVLITAAGSANDILWGEFADRGFLEPADLPSELATIPGLNWHAWKMTEQGKATFATDFQ